MSYEFVLKSNDIRIVIFSCRDDGSDGELQMLKQMRAASDGVKLIVQTNRMSGPLLARALNAGADGYLLKSLPPEALELSLRLVNLGQKVFPTELATMITSGQINPAAAEARLSSVNGLSPRELEILDRLTQGGPNKVIARQLGIAETTVKIHLKAVYSKIEVNNRTQAAVWAVRNGLGRDDTTKQNV